MHENSIPSTYCIIEQVQRVFKAPLLKHATDKMGTARYHLHSEITSTVKGKQHLWEFTEATRQKMCTSDVLISVVFFPPALWCMWGWELEEKLQLNDVSS